MPGVITNSGKILVLKRIGSDTATGKITKIRVGDDATTPTTADTDLKNKVPIFGTIIDGCETTSGWTPTNGALSLSENYIRPSYSITLSKTSTTNQNCFCEKTFNSFNLTSKKIYIFAYFSQTLINALNTSDSFWIRFGSDSSNYFYIVVNKANLTTGWRYFIIDENSQKVGNPNASAITYSQIGFKTASASTTIAAENFCFDNILIAGYDDFEAPISTGYPIVDETGLILKTRSVISSADALGFKLTEVGIVNNNGVLFSRDTYTQFTKNEYIEVIFLFEDIIQ